MDFIKFQLLRSKIINPSYQVVKDDEVLLSINTRFLSSTYLVSGSNGQELIRFKRKFFAFNAYEIFMKNKLLGKLSQLPTFRKFGVAVQSADKRFEIIGNTFKRKWIIKKEGHEIGIVVRKKRAYMGLIYEMAILENEDYNLLTSSVIIMELLLLKRRAAGG